VKLKSNAQCEPQVVRDETRAGGDGAHEEDDAIVVLDADADAHAEATHACARDRKAKEYQLKKATAGNGQGNTAKGKDRKKAPTEADFNAKLVKP
jgi:hypothetical protein